MFRPTQYNHTKMQLTSLELESRIRLAKEKKKHQKNGSKQIMEKMQILNQMDETDEEQENSDRSDSRDNTTKEECKETKTQEADKAVCAEKKESHTESAEVFKNEQRGEMIPSREKLREYMVWAEILGEPVSVKNRKKRVERIYGNQGHADRR